MADLPLVERVERVMDLISDSIQPHLDQVGAVQATQEVWSILVSIRKDLYAINDRIETIEDLAQRIMDNAETAEMRTKMLMALAGIGGEAHDP